jgi:hypothetical protein
MGIRFLFEIKGEKHRSQAALHGERTANYKRLIFVMAAYEGSIRFTIMYAPV